MLVTWEEFLNALVLVGKKSARRVGADPAHTEEQALLSAFGPQPPKERPTLEEVREAARRDPGLPCKKLAEYLGLTPGTPMSQQQLESLPEDLFWITTGTEHLLCVPEVTTNVWYCSPDSKAVRRERNGQMRHEKYVKKITNPVPNDPEVPRWAFNGVGITDEHCKRLTGYQTILRQVKRNLAHCASQDFIRNLGHSLRAFSPVSGNNSLPKSLRHRFPYGPTWRHYDEYRISKGIPIVIPRGRLLFTTAGHLEVLRPRNQNPGDNNERSWGPSTEPGIIKRCRDLGSRKSRVDLLSEPATGPMETIPKPSGC